MPRENQASLENLIEREDLGLDVLHPGGLDITQELAQLCHISKGTTVLDVAAGTGETACYLATHLGAQVVGVDLSDHMLERSKRKAEQRKLAIDFKKGDAHQLPFADDTFDAVISECTTCLLDKERAIREMVRVAKPHGLVGIHDICWRQNTPEALKKRLVDAEGERPETLEDWKRLFEKAGLLDVKTVDKSSLVPLWVSSIKKNLGFAKQLAILFRIVKIWGVGGLRNAWESQRIFQSKYTGYGIIIGRKPGSH